MVHQPKLAIRRIRTTLLVVIVGFFGVYRLFAPVKKIESEILPIVSSSPTEIVTQFDSSGSHEKAPDYQQQGRSSESNEEVIQSLRAGRSITYAKVDHVRVIKLLKDDTRGSKHQKFLVNLTNDLTLMVVHNIDLAPRVPVNVGDIVDVAGEFEFNKSNGKPLLHWTHYDPKGQRPDGYIRFNGSVYGERVK